MSINQPTEMEEASGSITADEFELRYMIEGEGIPCVVIGSVPNLPRQTFSQELRKHVRFIFMDSRMYVPTDVPVAVDKITLDTLVDDVERARKKLGLERIAILGNSALALVALYYAQKYPEYTSNVVMIGMTPYAGNRSEEAQRDYWETCASDERKQIRKANYEQLTEDTFSNARAFWAWYLASAPMVWYDPTYDASWLLSEVPLNMDVLKRFFKILPEYDFTQGHVITTPVFLALGRYDYLCPYYLWDECKDKLPTLSYNLFEQSGHFPMMEEQAAFDEKLIAWLGRW